VFRAEGTEWTEVPLPGLSSTDPVIAIGGDGGGGAYALAEGHVYRVLPEHDVRQMPDPPNDALIDLSVSNAGEVWVLATDPESLFHWRADTDRWQLHPLGVGGTRIRPTAIQALEMEYDGVSPPEGWEGHDIWIAGSSPGVGRFRVERPTVQLWLPRALRP
jgi:hypothetical protein